MTQQEFEATNRILTTQDLYLLEKSVFLVEKYIRLAIGLVTANVLYVALFCILYQKYKQIYCFFVII